VPFISTRTFACATLAYSANIARTRSRDCFPIWNANATYLSHGVGHVAVHNGSGSRAVSGVGSDNLSGIDGCSIGVVGRHTSHEGGGSSSGDSETHGDDLTIVSF